MTQLARVFDDQGRLAGRSPVGVIDIGSNSVRLVVYDGDVRAATPLYNEKVLCGLGRGVAETGRLADEAVERALVALRRFKAITGHVGVKKLRAIATAAVRDAENGQEFIGRGQEACGAAIEILPGVQEAELAAKGIQMGFVEPDGLVGDLGGGSLELINVAKGRFDEAATLPLGGLRLIEKIGGQADKAPGIIDKQIAKLDWIKKGRGRTFYAVGGTWRAIAKIHMASNDYPLRIMQGYSIATADMLDFCQTIRNSKRLSLMPGVDTISKQRREVVPIGAIVLERLLKAIQPETVVFSVFGIREGLLYDAMSPEEQRKDPLVSFCLDFARLRSRSVDHAHELCLWTDDLFGEEGLDETAPERRLRHAACLISDIGWRSHPDYRDEQSLNLVAHAGLSGIDHAGRIFLALAVYFRHNNRSGGGENQLSARLKAAVGKRALKRARIIGAAVRAAHMLSIGMPGVITRTPMHFEGDKLVIEIPRGLAALEGERLMRRFEALALLFERTAEVRIEA